MGRNKTLGMRFLYGAKFYLILIFDREHRSHGPRHYFDDDDEDDDGSELVLKYFLKSIKLFDDDDNDDEDDRSELFLNFLQILVISCNYLYLCNHL